MYMTLPAILSICVREVTFEIEYSVYVRLSAILSRPNLSVYVILPAILSICIPEVTCDIEYLCT